MNTKDRNHNLLQLFKQNGFKVVRLLGNMSIPAVILFENMVISCHVKDDFVYFTDKPKDGKVVLQIDLTEEVSGLRKVLLNILDQYEHRKCYRIELVKGQILKPLRSFYQEEGIYLKDYHYSHEHRAKLPIFSPGNDTKLYFEREKALEAVSKILDNVSEPLELEVV